MAHLNRHWIRKTLATAGLTVLLAATGLTSAGPALAAQGPTSERATTASSDDVAPQVACNGTQPSGWQYRGSYSYCYECRAAGMIWEATGKYRAHCQSYGDGARLWTFCVACRVEEAPKEDQYPVPSTESARLALDQATS